MKIIFESNERIYHSDSIHANLCISSLVIIENSSTIVLIMSRVYVICTIKNNTL